MAASDLDRKAVAAAAARLALAAGVAAMATLAQAAPLTRHASAEPGGAAQAGLGIAPRPAPAPAAWAPRTPEALVALVECHALRQAELDREARALSGAVWTLAHQSLFEAAALHEEAGRRVAALVDDETRRALLATYFPAGVEPAEPAARNAQRMRCRGLYAELDAVTR